MFQSLTSWWSALPPEVQGATIGAVATALAAIIGFGAVVVQIGRQARQALDQTRHNEALKLKLDIYREVIKITTTTTEEYGKYINFFIQYQIELNTSIYLRKLNNILVTPKRRREELIELQYRFRISGTEIISFVERWTSIDPRITLFQAAINAIQYEIDQSSRKYWLEVAASMPTQNNQDTSQTLPWTPPDDNGMNKINELTIDITDKINTWNYYANDFLVEMQNLLIKDLFHNEAPIRKPFDPKEKVLRLDNYDELMRYFENETEWGLNKQQTYRQVVGAT